jgi:hypothetical protein
MSEINSSYNNVSNNFLNELRRVSSDNKITNDEIRELLNKVETRDDMQIVEDFVSYDKQKVNLRVRSGSSEGAFNLDIDENSLELGDNCIEEKVNTSTGKTITLEYAKDESTIPSSKKVKGTIQEANEKINGILPSDKISEWSRVNKHDVNEVKSFINRLNLPMDKKAEFVAAYLTANYNHPGIDISWGGSSLQEGINAVPTDKDGRKYLDCEAYSKLATELLGGSSKYYGVHVPTNDDSQNRNHQVSVVRYGNNAYVISNNEIKKLEGTNGKSDTELITLAYPGFSNIKEDKSGPMRSGVDEVDVGQKLTLDNGAEVTVTSIDENNNVIKGKLKTIDGEEYNVIGTVNPDTGRASWERDYNVGDKLRDSSGNEITLTEKINDKTFKGRLSGRDVLVKINDDGSFQYSQFYKRGDTINTPNGTVRIDSADSSNQNFEATLIRNNGSQVRLRLRRHDDGLLYPVR